MQFIKFKSLFSTAAALGGTVLVKKLRRYLSGEAPIDRGLPVPQTDLFELDKQITRLACSYAFLTSSILQDLIAFPATNFDCDSMELTNRFLSFLTKRIIENNAVLSEEDIGIEANNLVWSIYDPTDPTPLSQRKVIFINSDFSAFFTNVTDWAQQFGRGIDSFRGLTDETQVDANTLSESVAYLPPKIWWQRLTFGNGASSGLQGIASQIVAMKILIETIEQKSLKGIVVVASISQYQHNPSHIVKGEELFPDAIIISEATGSITHGPCGISIGQLGRIAIDVSITKQFSIIDGTRIISEAAEASLNGFGRDDIIGLASRSAVDAMISSSEFSVRFIRTLTVGETPDLALNEIEGMQSVKKLLKAGGCVYRSEFESFPAWKTPRDSIAVLAVSETYRRTVSPYIDDGNTLEDLRKQPWFGARGRGDNSTGYPIAINSRRAPPPSKKWISDGVRIMPPIFAIGAGFVENHKLPGEYVNNDQLWAPIAVISRFPSFFIQCE